MLKLLKTGPRVNGPKEKRLLKVPYIRVLVENNQKITKIIYEMSRKTSFDVMTSVLLQTYLLKLAC